MKTKALLMTIAMTSVALAGCTGSDGVAEIDDETLQQLFEDNIQDFMNNTTVTVNQEIHYHNNTTVDSADNSVTTDNSITNNNGSGYGSQLQMFTVEWDWSDVLDYDLAGAIVVNNHNASHNSTYPIDLNGDGDYDDPGESSPVGNNNSNGNGSGNSGNTGDPALLYVLFYNNAVIEFRNVECSEWITYSYYDNGDWETWLRSNYGDNWNELDNKAYELEDHFRDNRASGYDAFGQCGLNNWVYELVVLYEVDLSLGEAMSFQVNGNGVIVDINCIDGYGTGLGNGTFTTFIGGQSECTVTGSTSVRYTLTSDIVRDEDGYFVYNSTIGDYEREYYTDFYSNTPESFAVYFTMHDVVVYDLDDE
tara:strand:+ start:59 stop:1150 length:1092 start_codon:yes stop_codon:yes gene_type:complete